MERQVVIQHPEGLHARPAAEFVKAASQLAGIVEVTHGAMRANAKSLLSVLSLGARAGDTVTLRVEGAEAVANLERLVQLLSGGQPEPPDARLTLCEILRQPRTWREALDQASRLAPEAGALLTSAKTDLILFTGCGSSYYLAIAAAGFFQELTGMAARAVPSSEVILSPGTYVAGDRRTALVAFSRSGTTTETVAACRAHRAAGRGPIIAVTCQPGSDLERQADLAIALPAASDQSVVMTSSFSSMLFAACVVAASLGENAGLAAELAALPARLDRDLEALRRHGEALGSDRNWSQFVFLGIGPFLGIASEAMLKLKEMTQVHCEAYSPLDFRHGPISIVGPGTMAIVMDSDRAAGHEAAVLEDIRRLGGAGLMLSALAGQGQSEVARSLLYMPLVQSLAYYRAVAEGRDPDRPQHLSRVVELGDQLG